MAGNGKAPEDHHNPQGPDTTNFAETKTSTALPLRNPVSPPVRRPVAPPVIPPAPPLEVRP